VSDYSEGEVGSDIVSDYASLLTEFAWATECQLATLEGLAMLRGSSQREMTRQFSITSRMVEACRNKSRLEASDCIGMGRLKRLLLVEDGRATLFEMFKECSVHGDFCPEEDRRY